MKNIDLLALSKTLRYQLLLLRGELHHLAPQRDSDLEVDRRFQELLRMERRLSEVFQRVTRTRIAIGA